MKIPDITDARLAELVAKIKPVITQKHVVGGQYKTPVETLHWLVVPEGTHHRNEAYTWSASVGEEAKGLEKMEWKETTVLIRWGYYGFFKPSFAEVFSQMSEDVLKEMVAFEINGPETRDDMFNDKWSYRILNEGFQLAIVTPYKKAA
jgi:hypothetical protein